MRLLAQEGAERLLLHCERCRVKLAAAAKQLPSCPLGGCRWEAVSGGRWVAVSSCSWAGECSCHWQAVYACRCGCVRLPLKSCVRLSLAVYASRCEVYVQLLF